MGLSERKSEGGKGRQGQYVLIVNAVEREKGLGRNIRVGLERQM